MHKPQQDFATERVWSYNHDRPHKALGDFIPKQHLPQAASLLFFKGLRKLGGLPFNLLCPDGKDN